METASREQQIRERAYAIWEGEGRPANRAETHWLRAEAEIAREGAQPDGRVARVPRRAAPAAKKRSPARANGAPAAHRRSRGP